MTTWFWKVPVGTLVFDGEEFGGTSCGPEEAWTAGAGGTRRQRWSRELNILPSHGIRLRAKRNPGKNLAKNGNLRLELKLLADVGLVGFPECRKVYSDFP